MTTVEVWLVTIGEPLPTDSSNERLYRTGMLADLLVSKGHKVVWWTSTFDHSRKLQRSQTDETIHVNEGLTMKLLHAASYSKNVSVARIVNHYRIAKKFYLFAQSQPKPDIIVCSLPTLELSQKAAQYGKKHRVPVVLDIRDLWPDVFLELGPNWTKPLLRKLLTPMYRTSSRACRDATALIGLTPAFVEWGAHMAKRLPAELDRDFPMGYTGQSPTEKAIQEAEAFWSQYGLHPNDNHFIACFFGTMGRQFELDDVIKAAKQLAKTNTSIRFVLCGDGDHMERYKASSADCPSLIFPGWVGAAEIWTLMRMSKAGLAPYKSIPNFTMNLPNKPIEYLSGGLPVLSSLQEGVLKELLSAHSCGVTYRDADELTEALQQLYQNSNSLTVMRKNAARLYKESFVAEKVYDEMAHYLEVICKNYGKRV